MTERLLAVDGGDTPLTVTPSEDGRTLTVDWRYADARWLDLMRVHRMRRASRLVLSLDPDARRVRVREYWSALDVSAGAGGLRFQWHAASGMQFFNVQTTRVFGAQLGPDGKPTGELSRTFQFDIRSMKQPLIEAVTGSGWAWQPVMWNAPDRFRWLTE